MSGALEVGRKDASRDRIQGSASKGTTMLTLMDSQIISALTHGALRGPISRKRVAHGRTMKSVGATTTTGVTLVSAMGALRMVGALRTVSALMDATGALRMVGTLMSARRATGSFRRCHIYLATGISIRGSGVVSTPSSADRF
jgi:hypothetical protein